MKELNQHPTHEEMLEAVASGKISFATHLLHCKVCREQFAMLCQLSEAKEFKLSPAPEAGLYRHASIARIAMTRNPSRREAGTLAFDSWTERPTAALRDKGSSLERRLRFKAGQFVVEIVMERMSDVWECVARVYIGGKPTRNAILRVGRKKLFVTANDCFLWESNKPPKTMSLLTSEAEIDLGILEW